MFIFVCLFVIWFPETQAGLRTCYVAIDGLDL